MELYHIWLILGLSNIAWAFLYFCKSLDLNVVKSLLDSEKNTNLELQGWSKGRFMGKVYMIPPYPPRSKASASDLNSPTSSSNNELIETLQLQNKLLAELLKRSSRKTRG